MRYKVILDDISREEWEYYVSHFADYSIYQTWPYQQVRAESDGQKISRVIVKDDNDKTVLMAQVRIATIKPFGPKVGYIQSGPLVCGQEGKSSCSPNALEELCRSYVGSIVSVLRVVPNIRNDETGKEFANMLDSVGFKQVQHIRSYHTFIVSLNKSNEDILASIHRESRRNIRKAEKQNIELREGTGEEFFNILETLYAEAKKRKGFKGIDSQEFAKTQRMLADDEKAKVLIAYYDGRPVTAYATTHFGNTAVPIIWANTKTGLECGSPYLVLWRTYLSARDLGMKYYDLGGVNKKENPKGYLFKKRMGGNPVCYIGAYEVCTGAIVRSVWRGVEQLYNFIKK